MTRRFRGLSVAVSALLSLGLAVAPGIAATAQEGDVKTTSFVLNAQVLDGGQQVVSVTIDTPDGVDPAALDASTFSVRAKGANKYRGLDPATVSGEFDVERQVRGVNLDQDGDVVVRLAYGEGVPGAQTFGYAGDQSRNIMLALDYTVTQRKPLRLKNGQSVSYTGFDQGAVVDPEVDAFSSGTSKSGLRYRLYSPGTPRASAGAAAVGVSKAAQGKAKPLVVFLHGGGEGGWSQAYDNDLQLIANRGALGFATREAQAMFGGAYVVAPQAFTKWLDDGRYDYTSRLKSLVNQIVAEKNIDPNRISVIGPSNGGYMTMKLASAYPHFFSAAVPVCPVVAMTGTTYLSDTQIRALRSTPTWFVHATNDPIVPFESNTAHARALLPKSLLTTYPNVVRKGYEFNGHFAWVYASRNDPALSDGTSLWEWMAAQRRR